MTTFTSPFYSEIWLKFIIDDSNEYLRSISNRIYLEEAGYWGLVALRERENADVRNANEKYFG